MFKRFLLYIREFFGYDGRQKVIYLYKKEKGMTEEQLQQLVKEALYKGFLKDAKDNLTSASKQRVDFTKNANNFGGVFTDLPEGVTYYDIMWLLDNHYWKGELGGKK